MFRKRRQPLLAGWNCRTINVWFSCLPSALCLSFVHCAIQKNTQCGMKKKSDLHLKLDCNLHNVSPPPLHLSGWVGAVIIQLD